MQVISEVSKLQILNDENETNEAQSPAGQIVYRRTAPPGDSDQRRPGGNGAPTAAKQMAPSLTPLLMGFALLLFLILLLGYFGVRKIEDTSRQVLDMEHQHASMLSLLLQLRVALTRMDNEARDRAEAERSEEHTSELQSRSDLVCRL